MTGMSAVARGPSAAGSIGKSPPPQKPVLKRQSLDQGDGSGECRGFARQEKGAHGEVKAGLNTKAEPVALAIEESGRNLSEKTRTIAPLVDSSAPQWATRPRAWSAIFTTV